MMFKFKGPYIQVVLVFGWSLFSAIYSTLYYYDTTKAGSGLLENLSVNPKPLHRILRQSNSDNAYTNSDA